MKIYGLIGKSGTGKSFQAVNLSKKINAESIIDDGLFIYCNNVMAGISAKRQKTKVAAVKAALYYTEEHRDEVVNAIKKVSPKSILILGTSDAMVDKIVKRLDLPPVDERIYIEDITDESERSLAEKHRKEMGQHVIPAPTFQLKKQFSGYFMAPLKHLFREFGHGRELVEKSVVRPTYSYMGEYKISERVISDIAECVKSEIDGMAEITKMAVFPVQEGVEVYIAAEIKYGVDLPGTAHRYQGRLAEMIEKMTAFNVNKLELEIKDVV